MAIDGTWNITTKTPMGDQDVTATVVSSGDALTGTATGPFGTVEIEDGKLDGDKASWTLNITTPLQMSLKHQAVFVGDTVTGEVELGMFGKATFSGARA